MEQPLADRSHQDRGESNNSDPLQPSGFRLRGSSDAQNGDGEAGNSLGCRQTAVISVSAELLRAGVRIPSLIRFIIFLWALSFGAAFCGHSQTAPRGGSTPDAGLKRFEVGFEAADLHFSGCPYCPAPQSSLAAGAVVNVNPYLALESRFDLTSSVDCYDSPICGGRATEFLLGPRAEARSRRWGLFGEAEPGLVSWSAASNYETLNETFNIIPVRRTFLSMELGGGVEYSPVPGLVLRGDLGDLLTRYEWETPLDVSCNGCKGWINNVQASTGAYWSVGKPLSWIPPDTHATPSRKFFDRTNLALLTVSLLGQASDAITTQRFRSHGLIEGDPLARPFVDQGWPGQIGLAAIDNGAQLSIMFFLHRTGHHRFERIVPVLFGGASGVMGYRNDQR